MKTIRGYKITVARLINQFIRDRLRVYQEDNEDKVYIDQNPQVI